VAGDQLRITVTGAREVQRALAKLPRDARRELRVGSDRLARRLANAIRAAGRADTRQSARASRSVRVAAGDFPTVVAGPHPLLMGSEFGVKARFGWYRRARYFNTVPRQYRGRTAGNAGYWFFPTYRAEQPTIRQTHSEMADAIIRQWSA
jgi:hypothetical protein